MITAEEVGGHEAGHAVAASVLEGARPVESASVVPDAADDSRGHVMIWVRRSAERVSWESHLAEAIGCRVGEIAGARSVGRKQPDEMQGPDWVDYYNEISLARRSTPPAPLPILGRVEKLSAAFATIAWPTIEDVARQLSWRRVLTGDEVRSIVARRWPQKITVQHLDMMMRSGEAQAVAFCQFAVAAAVTKQVCLAELDNELRRRARAEHYARERA